MSANLKAKLLQHLAKKKADEGFTLIELLVVIVIIGILAAIALPSFLSQSAKAKQAEARNTLSAWVRGQKAFRENYNQFATNWTDLALGMPTDTKNYTYEQSGGGTDSADLVTATAKSKSADLKGYAAAAAVRTVTVTVGGEQNREMSGILCEANAPGKTAPAAPTNTNGLACGSGT
ncbi:MAG: type IV pilin-like G/H family protein, partial [Gloeomargarita sp. GMQP_bins_14]